MLTTIALNPDYPNTGPFAMLSAKWQAIETVVVT